MHVCMLVRGIAKAGKKGRARQARRGKGKAINAGKQEAGKQEAGKQESKAGKQEAGRRKQEVFNFC